MHAPEQTQIPRSSSDLTKVGAQREPTAPRADLVQPQRHTVSEMMGHVEDQTARMARFSSFHHLKFQILHLDCAPKHANCPDCGSQARRCGKVERGPILDASLEGPVFLHVLQGVYRCKQCLPTAGCRGRKRGRTFRFRLPFTVVRGRYTHRARRFGIDGARLDGMPFTKVAKRLARELNIKPARSTVWRWHSQEGDAATGELDCRPWAREALSGVLCMDELYDGEFCLLCATDPLAKVTVGFLLVDKKEVDAEKVSEFMQYLTMIGAKPDVVITDESKLYPAALKESWSDVVHALCEFHFIRHLVQDVVASVRAYVQSMPKDPKRRRGRPSKRGRPRVHHNEKRKEVSQKRFLVAKNPGNMTEAEQATLQQLFAEHPALAVPRDFILSVYQMLSPDGNPEQAESLRQKILNDPRFQNDKHLAISLERLKDDERFAKLTVFLRYENLNRTNNDVERDNRRFRKKQKSHYRLRTARTIRNALYMKMKQEQEALRARGQPVPKLRPRTEAASNFAA